jgi:hypothetical protein
MKLIDIANRRRAVLLATPFIYDTDMQAVIDKAIAESFDLPPTATLKAMNTLILSLKSDGIWSKLDTIFNFATGSTLFANFSRICWKRRVLGTFHGGLTYTASGLEGNATNAYFDTNYNFSTGTNYTLANASFGAILYKEGVNMPIAGHSGATNINYLYNRDWVGHRINRATNVSASLDFTGIGFMSIQRSSLSVIERVNKSSFQQLTSQADSNLLVNESFTGLRERASYSSGGMSELRAGSNLTNTEAQNFRTAYNNYLQKIGLTQFA